MTQHRLLQNYTAWLTAKPFVRGGLSDPAAAIADHSLAAVERAIDAGHGIVLEAQLTFDNDAVVFGESTLDRLTGLEGTVREYSSARLQAQTLKGTDETLPSLSTLLLDIGGRTPVLIDACRVPKDPLPLCFAIRRAIEGYGGPIGIMSYDPRVIRWFKDHSRRVARGLVIIDRTDALPWWTRNWLWRAWALWRSSPDFLTVDLAALPSSLAARMRQRNLPVLAGTVHSEEDLALARQHASNHVFAARLTERAPSLPEVPALAPDEGPLALASA